MAAHIPPLDSMKAMFNPDEELVAVIRNGRVYSELRKNVGPDESIATVEKCLNALITPKDTVDVNTFEELHALMLAKELK